MIRKLGLVLECDAGGPDELVFTCLVRRLSPETEVVVRTLGNKPAIFERGPDVARELVETDDCDLVLIVWDLKPPRDNPASCVAEDTALRQNLSGIPPATRRKIRPLCLTYELETWLLADDAAVRDFLSRPAHRCGWRLRGNADSFEDAKAALNKVVNDFRGHKYCDFREAIQIAMRWTRTSRLCRVPSFQRFLQLLTGNPAAEFQQDASTCRDLSHQGAMMGR